MPSTPQVVPTVILFDYLKDDAGMAQVGAKVTVVLNSTSPVTTITPLVVLAQEQQTTTTDGNGYWQFSLVPNTNISPANTTYTVLTPAGTYDVTLGATGPYQSTAFGTIVNVIVPLAPATTPGPVTISGNLTVTGVLTAASAAITGALSAAITTISGLLTAAAGLVVSGGTGATLNASGDLAVRSVTVLSGTGPYAPSTNAAPGFMAMPYGISPSVSVGPTMVNLQAAGADMSGATLSDAAVTKALGQLPSGGGVLYSPAGTLLISAHIPLANALNLVGDGRGASEIKWGGAINSTMVDTNPAAGQNVSYCGIRGIGLNANSVAGVTPLLLNSVQYGQFSDMLLQGVSGAGIPALRMEVNAGTSSTNNTVGNNFFGLYLKNVPVGIQMAGQLSGSTNTYCTNNRFYSLYMDAISGTGIRIVQWCDSNAFFGTQLALTSNNAIGIILNDSATPAADVGVYNSNFYHLSIDSFGITGAIGIKGNWAKQTQFQGVYHSPVVFNGTLFQDNNLQSYELILTQDNASTNNMVRKTKNYTYDSGGGSGLATNYINSIVQTVTTTGNSPLLKALGDTNLDIQISGAGTGKVLAGTQFAHFLQLYGGAGSAIVDAESATTLALGPTNANLVAVTPTASFSKDIRRSRQTPSEAVLVSGVDATAGELVYNTLTAARLVGAPLNAAIGQYLTFEFTQGGAGGFAVTWNAVFKKTWADTGNTTGKISTITFVFDGGSWVQTGAQAPYV